MTIVVQSAIAETFEVLGRLAGASWRKKRVNSRGCREIDAQTSILGGRVVLAVTTGMSPCDHPVAALAEETSSSNSLPLALQRARQR